MKECYVCKTTHNIVRHHVFYGTGNRKISEKYKLFENLCSYHHNMSNEGVHFNKELDNEIKQKWQNILELQFMNDGMNQFQARDTFILLIGRNYL